MSFPHVDEEELDGEGLELPTRFTGGLPGGRPGIDLDELASMPAPAERVPITCIDYSPDRVETRHVTDFEEFIHSRRAPWVKVRWINVDGLQDVKHIEEIGRGFGIHPLVLEDIVNTGTRPKFEDYGDHLFITVKMLTWDDKNDGVIAEHLSLVLGRRFLLTFQEKGGDVFDPESGVAPVAQDLERRAQNG